MSLAWRSGRRVHVVRSLARSPHPLRPCRVVLLTSLSNGGKKQKDDDGARQEVATLPAACASSPPTLLCLSQLIWRRFLRLFMSFNLIDFPTLHCFVLPSRSNFPHYPLLILVSCVNKLVIISHQTVRMHGQTNLK